MRLLLLSAAATTLFALGWVSHGWWEERQQARNAVSKDRERVRLAALYDEACRACDRAKHPDGVYPDCPRYRPTNRVML